MSIVVVAGGGSEGEAGGVVRPAGESPPGTGQTFANFGSWLGHVDGRKYVVFAGARLLPSTGKSYRSEVLVYDIPSGEYSRPMYDGVFLPPGGGREPLKITAAHGAILTIKTSAGAMLHFDVATRRFQ